MYRFRIQLVVLPTQGKHGSMCGFINPSMDVMNANVVVFNAVFAARYATHHRHQLVVELFFCPCWITAFHDSRFHEGRDSPGLIFFLRRVPHACFFAGLGDATEPDLLFAFDPVQLLTTERMVGLHRRLAANHAGLSGAQIKFFHSNQPLPKQG